MREIIWMLRYDPTDDIEQSPFRFFAIDTNNEIVSAYPNVVSMDDIRFDTNGTLHDFAGTFTILYKFRCLYKRIFQHTKESTATQMAPMTIQLYSNALKDFECSIIALANDIEMQLIVQDPDKTYTIVWIYEQFLPQIRFMNHLFNIHQRVYVDYVDNPGKPIDSQIKLR